MQPQDSQDDPHRKNARVGNLRFFAPAQRIWRLYVREADETLLERNWNPEVRAANDRLEEFREHRIHPVKAAA